MLSTLFQEGEEQPKKESRKSQKDGKEDKVQKSNVKGKDSKKEKKSDTKENKGEDDGNDDDEMASDDDDEVDKSFRNEPWIVLYHSLNNKLESDNEEEDIDVSENKKVSYNITV